MTKHEALYNFFNGFGLTAYPQSSVPDDVIYPYLTYENVTANRGNVASTSVNIYYHTDSEAVPNAKAEQIAQEIGGGIAIPSDDGTMYVYFDSTWQAVADDSDTAIKRRFTNLTIAFNTK